jgi:hypothetical protein
MIMKKITQIIAMIYLISLSATMPAKEIRPTDDINAIGDAIAGAEAGDVIILERGKYYLTQATIDVNVDLTIQVDETTEGRPPVIALVLNEDASLAKVMMFVRANITCKGIHFHGGISGQPAHTDVKRAIVFVETPNMRAEFEDCWWEDFDARTVQLEAEDISFFATNCRWVDDHKTVGPTEGRSIDCRQFGPDTLFLQNCTFVNAGNRWIRHMPSSGRIDPINYCFIDHCTFLNAGGYHPAFDLGTVEELYFTNNIVDNPGIMGTDFMRRPSKNDGQFLIADPADYNSTDGSLAPYRLSEVYYDREDGITVFACHGVDSIGTEITMHHNNAFRDDRIAAKLATNDTLSEAAWMCTQFENSLVGSVADAFASEELAFVEEPALDVDAIIDPYTGYWDKNQFFVMDWTAPDSIDLSYGTEAAAYTGAEDGFPLGDLNWYPDQKARWEAGEAPVGIVRYVQDGLTISNFPNPFSQSTTIRFTLNQASTVNFSLYNTLGAVVRTCEYVSCSQGQNEFLLNKGDLMPGIYFLRLSAGQESGLIKISVK